MNINSTFLKRVSRFSFTGLGVTAAYVVITTMLIEHLLLSPPLANGAAFIVATLTSYLINTLWSFNSQLHKENLIRFFTVSCIGFFITIIISFITQYYGLWYGWGIFFVVCTVTPLTFLLHNFWTYPS